MKCFNTIKDYEERMNNTSDIGTKKGLLSYLQPGRQGCDEENTKRQISKNEEELKSPREL